LNTENDREPSETELLLPWYAAGTLDRRDAARVEAALADDPELARRYAAVREELGQTIHLNETLGAPPPRAMTDLFAKIDAEPARVPATAGSLAGRIREFFAALSPRTLAWSAGAAALAILLQAGVIAGFMINKNGGGYQTASAPAQVSAQGSYALIRFNPQASAADIAGFLERNRLSIVSGPTAGGLYRVRIADTKLQRAELAGIADKLQNDKVVAFVAVTE
jgi:anti-sigma factor RsiW